MTNSLDLKTIDRNLVTLLKLRREQTQISLADLAERVGIAPITLMRMEAGIVPMSPALTGRLLDELGCDFGEIWSRASQLEGRFTTVETPAANCTGETKVA